MLFFLIVIVSCDNFDAQVDEFMLILLNPEYKLECEKTIENFSFLEWCLNDFDCKKIDDNSDSNNLWIISRDSSNLWQKLCSNQCRKYKFSDGILIMNYDLKLHYSSYMLFRLRQCILIDADLRG